MNVIIVDTNDKEIGVKDVKSVDWPHDIYRASAIWLYNGNGELLIAQRHPDKHSSPNCWAPSAAGMVEAGETYQENILKETKEEIGVTLTTDNLTVGPKILMTPNDPKRQYFIHFFFAKCNLPIEDFVLQKDEVVAVKWMMKEKLLTECCANPELFSDVVPEVIHKIEKTDLL